MEYKTNEEENVMFMCVQNNQLKALIYFISSQTLKIDIN